ncbi:mechanosensitive ion channel domain-containing protein [Rhodoligotrophos defluvii]|uniref:mechanosensitive ion channel domain-containing protein n=1 Tax=Rhodoligotrophos defluvii TaxID=2561934 RepID=UPI00148506A9|nr:DUF3772 domain-containing protein [Rhodoligotrophos defluvii]
MARLIALLLVLWTTAFAAWGQDATLDRIQRQIDPINQQLEQLKNQIVRVDLPTAALDKARAQIEDIRTATLQMIDALQPQLAAANQALEQLGPPPEGGAEEAPGIAEQRKTLTARRDQIRALQAQLDLIRVTTQQLSEQASRIQHDRFFSKIFESDHSVLDPRLWIEGSSTIEPFVSRFMTVASNWWNRLAGSLTPFGTALLLGELAAAIAASVAARHALDWLIRPRRDKSNPSDLERLWNIFAGTIAAAAPLILASGLIYLALSSTIEASPQATRIYWTIASCVTIIATGRAFIHGIFAPAAPRWRIIGMSDGLAHRISSLLELTFIIYAIDGAFRRLAEILFVPVQFSVLQGAVTSILTVSLVVLVLLTLRSGEEAPQGEAAAPAPEPPARFGWASRLPLFFWGVAATIAAALVLGLIALAQYLSQQLVVLTILIVFLVLIHYLADQLVSDGIKPNRPAGRFLRRNLLLSNKGADRVGVAITTLVDFGLVFIGVPLVVLQTAVTWVDITSWLNTAFFGFRLGGITISLYTVMAAILAFAVGVVITKLFTRWLDARVLARTQLNKGLRDSIHTGVTYAGVILAGVFALSYAGVDFASLAIIAGALGVGIGFGLQSIVNNFVSGLILLAERPIKVGDLIKVTGGQGIVKRINVRSTEIETVDKASVIVPNSSLISETVQNWTHTDTVGRALVAVRADADADPEKVLQLMTDCAKRHQQVLAFPAPLALFTNFGAAANEFELYAYVADVTTTGLVASDLRVAIRKAFEENNIGMPYNVQEVKFAARAADKAKPEDGQGEG